MYYYPPVTLCPKQTRQGLFCLMEALLTIYQVRPDEALYNALDRAAHKAGLTRNGWIERAVRRHYHRLHERTEG